MRRNRIIWLVFFIMSVVAISFYGGSVSYGIFFVLTAIPVVSLLYILLVIVWFKIYQKLEGRNVVANHRTDFYFTLQNESLLAFAGIRVLFYSDYSTIDGLDDRIEYELAPHSGIRKQTGLICRYRGEYEVGIRTIIVTDLFRLFSISYKNKEPLRVTVRPDIVKLSALNDRADIITSARDIGTDMTEPDVLVREYAPGDDRRMIHWKASAASGKLMVRNRIAQQRSGVAIIMDPRRIREDPAWYIPIENRMLEEAIALTLYYCSKNVRVGFMSRNITSDVDSMDGFESFYESMCLFDFDEDPDITSFYNDALFCGSVMDKTGVYYLTHTWDEGSREFTKQLSYRGQTVTVILTCIKGQTGDLSSDDIIVIGTDDDLKEVLE